MKYLSRADSKELKGTALLRLDFNTEDEWRMEAAIPTIRFLLKHCEKLVILSHRGRPQGADKKFSLKKDAQALQELLKNKVRFIPHFRFSEIRKNIYRSPAGSIFLLENLRFMPGEEKNDAEFAGQLASLAEDFYPRVKRETALSAKTGKLSRCGAGVYVNDAFAVSHRNDASVVAITKFLPSYAGLELEKEMTFLSRAMKNPKKPLVIILGGAKAHDKLGVLKFFRKKAGWFLLGGAAANTLLFLKGADTGKSLIDSDTADLKKLRAVLGYKNLILPTDWLTEKKAILDIGKKTEGLFLNKIGNAKTVIWSGPLGAIEKEKFSHGTLAIAQGVASNKGVFSIVGGGETVMFLKKRKLDKKFSFISTGGGAMLDFLAGEKLPGIETLKKKRA